jgi:putative ABC transport system substrate-binding protein
MNNRRKLIIALGAGALAAPLSSFAQQQDKVWRIGYLASRAGMGYAEEAFRQGLRELGYVEGKNTVIEWHFADGHYERFPGLAADVVRLKVDIIVASGTPATSATQKATTTIPVVMVNVGDPVELGFVKNLARPGGNITGLSNVLNDIAAKHLEMLLSMVPKLSLVAILGNPGTPSFPGILKNIQAGVQKAGVKVLPVEAQDVQGIQNAFSTAARKNAGAIIVLSDGLFNQQGRQIAELAMKHRLPAISVTREYAEIGGLMSYGPSFAEIYRRAATYVDKILKGAKPGDLPVEQPMTLELVINRKTAKALGLTIPQSLLISADKVIE